MTSAVVAGRFECVIRAEEAMSESLLRFARDDVALVPLAGSAQGDACVLIRARRPAERRLAVRTLRGRGAAAIEVVIAAVPAPAGPVARGDAPRRQKIARLMAGETLSSGGEGG